MSNCLLRRKTMKKNKTFTALFLSLVSFCFVFFAVFYLFCLTKNTTFAKILSTPETKNYHWVAIEPNFEPEFYHTKEAIRIGDNLLLFQSSYGGWNKNIHVDADFNIFEKLYILCDKSLHEMPTIDNSATTTEIDYLSKLYNATHQKKYKKAVIKGIKYLLKMQNAKGGFPQAFPLVQHEYQKYITYNDRANINVMTLFYKIINNNQQYKFVGKHLKEKIKESFRKGLDCLLKTQLPGGAWASQYNHETLEPARARIYELAAIDSRETANILLFLMDLKDQPEDVLHRIEKGIQWLDEHKITDFEMVRYINDDGEQDIKIAECHNCPPMWARMYDVSTDIPLFSDRSGKIFTDMNDVSYERRIHYEWYVFDGNIALEKYQVWKNNR